MQSSIIFEAKTVNYKCSLSYEIANSIPAIKIALTRFNESKSQKYAYGGETTVNAVKVYLGWKKSVVTGSLFTPVVLSPQDWKYVMFLSVYMADFDFFDTELGGPEFPSLEFMLEEIPNLPTEGLVPYLEEYLTSVFYKKVEWCSYEKHKSALAIVENKQYFEDKYNIVEGNFINYKDTFEMVVTATRLVYGVLEPKVLIHCNFDVEKLKNAKIDREYYDQIIEKWVKINLFTRENIVCAYYEYESYKIGVNFYQDWTNFFTKQPTLAKLIWSSMDRNELLTITNVATKRRGTASKLNFEEMQEYVKRFTPKDHVVDPIEIKLKQAIVDARRGVPSERCSSNIYISSDEIIIAEAKLENYIARRKIRQQQEEAKVAKQKRNECVCYADAPKIQFAIAASKKGFKVNKL